MHFITKCSRVYYHNKLGCFKFLGPLLCEDSVGFSGGVELLDSVEMAGFTEVLLLVGVSKRLLSSAILCCAVWYTPAKNLFGSNSTSSPSSVLSSVLSSGSTALEIRINYFIKYFILLFSLSLNLFIIIIYCSVCCVCPWRVNVYFLCNAIIVFNLWFRLIELISCW